MVRAGFLKGGSTCWRCCGFLIFQRGFSLLFFLDFSCSFLQFCGFKKVLWFAVLAENPCGFPVSGVQPCGFRMVLLIFPPFFLLQFNARARSFEFSVFWFLLIIAANFRSFPKFFAVLRFSGTK